MTSDDAAVIARLSLSLTAPSTTAKEVSPHLPVVLPPKADRVRSPGTPIRNLAPGYPRKPARRRSRSSSSDTTGARRRTLTMPTPTTAHEVQRAARRALRTRPRRLGGASTSSGRETGNPASTPRPCPFITVRRRPRTRSDRPRWFNRVRRRSRRPYFQAGHAGSIPVTRSLSRSPAHRCGETTQTRVESLLASGSSTAGVCGGGR